MIHVIIDFSNIILDDEYFVIHDNLSYLQARIMLSKLKLPLEEKTFVIKQKIYHTWIERFLNRLDESDYTVEIASLKSSLQSKWGCSIPKEITDDDIREGGLMDFEETPASGESFDDFVLRISFGDLLGRKSLTLEAIPALIKQSKTETWNKSVKLLFLRSMLEQRLAHWQTKNDKNLRFLLDKFIKSPSLLYKDLITFSVLKAYKTIGLRTLHDFPVYDSMSLPLDKIIFADNELQDIANLVEYEINSWALPTDQNSFNEYISKLGGRLELEYHTIDRIIENNPDLLNKDIISLLREKFRLLSSVYDSIEALEKRIPPPFPSFPEIEWTTNQILDWAVNEYFPYYNWSLLSLRKFHLLEPISLMFSDWFSQNYENIKYNSGKMLFNFVPNNFEEFTDENQMNVVLMVDNLPWFFSEILTDALDSNGYYLRSSTPYFAHIPTLTEYCKKCLVSAEPNYNNISHPSYSQILEKGGWLLFKKDLRLKYYPTIGAFYKEKELNGSTHVINYLQLDELLHKTEEELGVSHIQAARETIATMMVPFIEHIDKITKDKSVRLHIISDHGATFLEPTKNELLTKEIIRSKGLQSYSYRYAAQPGSLNDMLTPDLVSNTYQIDKEKFSIPSHFILARGFKSLVPNKGHIMSHGGLQPEEVIIPHMIFEKIKAVALPPQFIQLKNKYRYAVQDVSLEVGNPNKVDIAEIYVSILNSNFEADKTTIKLEAILPKSKVTVTFTGRFKQTSNQFEKENLKLGIRYIAEGSQFNIEINLPIIMISIVETDDQGIFDDF